MKIKYNNIITILTALLLSTGIGYAVERTSEKCSLSPDGEKIFFMEAFAPQEGFIKGKEKDTRKEICLNGKWDFMPVEINHADLSKVTSPVFPKAPVWESIPYKVPSPWNVNGFSKGGGGDFIAFPSYPEEWEKVKAGWVHKRITIPEDWRKSRIIIRFEAVAGYTKVYANGKEVCSNFDSFLPFSADITDFCSAGDELDLMVWIAHSSFFDQPGRYGYRPYPAGSFWGTYIVGIWQDVSLLSVPAIYIEDTFIKPDVSKNSLVAELTINNATGERKKINIAADIRKWINDSDTSILSMPVPNWHLSPKPSLKTSMNDIWIVPGINKVKLEIAPNGALELWEPGTPTLYGATINLKGPHGIRDCDYERFGWREFSIEGKKVLLNGKQIVMKGDSWHFMGIPQMTRRYAYSWYKMLKDANGNAVRLHAQVYPEFYLDMADEMGICVLDESALWASDGGPKMDSGEMWERSRDHIRRMVIRDRNHASVFGWSVCNEMMGVMDGVFRDKERLDEIAGEINRLVKTAREYDGTRDWISGDGEVQREIEGTVFLGHYYTPQMLLDWSKSDKPWGIGEMGMCYAGTPEDVSVINGDRAFESQEGRMEGLAGEAFSSISEQRDLGASYTCIFNLAWYGIQPLEMGLEDTSRPINPNDGIWFSEFKEGIPGVQPERIGPYTTTFNPGYDPELPLYRTWPLFDGVKAAFSDNYKKHENIWAIKKATVIDEPIQTDKEAVWISDSEGNDLFDNFKNISLAFSKFNKDSAQFLIADGRSVPVIPAKEILESISKGSTLFICGISENIIHFIETITGTEINMEERNATSYIIKAKHPILNGQSPSTLYFSEKSNVPVSKYVIDSKDFDRLLEPCNTDWTKWNYQGENIKTGQILRSEREYKPDGGVMLRKQIGNGEIIISAINPFILGNTGHSLIYEMFHNLGVEFTGTPRNIPEAISADGYLTSALSIGSISQKDQKGNDMITMINGIKLRPGSTHYGKYWNSASADKDHFWNFMKAGFKGDSEYCSAYLSFWIFSPRSLTDLLIEPNIPRLDLEYTVDDYLNVYINGNKITEGFDKKDVPNEPNALRGLPLEKGWNHILLEIGQDWGGWNGKFRFVSSDSDYMEALESAIIR